MRTYYILLKGSNYSTTQTHQNLKKRFFFRFRTIVLTLGCFGRDLCNRRRVIYVSFKEKPKIYFLRSRDLTLSALFPVSPLIPFRCHFLLFYFLHDSKITGRAPEG